jgi:hypothetical protein
MMGISQNNQDSILMNMVKELFKNILEIKKMKLFRC